MSIILMKEQVCVLSEVRDKSAHPGLDCSLTSHLFTVFKIFFIQSFHFGRCEEGHCSILVIQLCMNQH